MSLMELHLVKGPFELYEVGMNLSPADSVVPDGVGVIADLAGGSNSSADGVMAGQHDDGD